MSKRSKRKYDREWYANHPEYRSRQIELKKKKKQEKREWLNKLKDSLGGCAKCQEKDIKCLDFHHIGDKKGNIADAIKNSWSKERILEEISKCILLCCNCHRKETYRAVA